MLRKRRLFLIVGILFLAGIVTFGVANLYPFGIFPNQQKPEQEPQKVYDLYMIIDEETNKTLMYVPFKVNVADEVISEENKRYQVVRVEENRAYARFVENVDLQKYKPQPK
jgi:hypothetical protein